MNARKEKIYRYEGFNIKLFTNRERNAKTYFELIFKIYSESIIGEIDGDKGMILRLAWTDNILFDNQKNQILYGKLTRFTIINGKRWFNSKLKDFQNVDIPIDLFPNPYETDFIFVPQIHRFFIRKHPRFSSSSVKKFLEKALSSAKKPSDTVTVDPITSKDLISRIISSNNLVSLDVNVTYTNSDVGDVASAAIDKMLKEASAGGVYTEIRPDATGKLNSNSTFVKGLLGLAAENGSAVAIEKDANGKKHRIVTSDHSEVLEVSASNEDQVVENFFLKVMKRWRRNGRPK